MYDDGGGRSVRAGRSTRRAESMRSAIRSASASTRREQRERDAHTGCGEVSGVATERGDVFAAAVELQDGRGCERGGVESSR
jgi:hypothetical protein